MLSISPDLLVSVPTCIASPADFGNYLPNYFTRNQIGSNIYIVGSVFGLTSIFFSSHVTAALLGLRIGNTALCLTFVFPESLITNPFPYQEFFILVTRLCTFLILLQYIFSVIWYLCGSLTIGFLCSDLWCSNHLWNLLPGLFTFSFPSLLPSFILLRSHLCLLIVHPNMSDFQWQKENTQTHHRFLFWVITR